jgi:hypothetical protein
VVNKTLTIHIPMKVSPRITKYQAGGAAPGGDPSQGAPGGAPAGGDPSQGGSQDPSQGQDPVSQLVQLAQQALQGQDCQAAMAVCDGLLSLIQQQGGQGDPSQGGGAPPEGGAPAGEQGPPSGPPSQRNGGVLRGRPVFRKGGLLVRRTY